jgi:hypothetical protein
LSADAPCGETSRTSRTIQNRIETMVQRIILQSAARGACGAVSSECCVLDDGAML